MKDPFKQSLLAWWSFIKKPADQHPQPAPFLKTILPFLIFELVVLLPFMLLLSATEKVFNFNLENHAMEQLLKDSPFMAISLAVILAPLLEEFVFRFFISLRRAFFFTIPLKIYASLRGFSSFTTNRLLVRIWPKLFPAIYYVSVFSFGFVHILNFPNAEQLLWFIPLITFPQILLGSILGYLRVKFGFIYNLAFHALHNGVLIIPLVLYQLLFET